MHSSDDRNTENDVERKTTTAVSFRPKGIGANLFLTAAAALVPMLILGVSAYTTINGQKTLGKRKRPASK